MNDQPRRLRSLLIAIESDVAVGIEFHVTRRGRLPGAGVGSYRQMYAASDPNSSINSIARLALLIVDSI